MPNLIIVAARCNDIYVYSQWQTTDTVSNLLTRIHYTANGSLSARIECNAPLPIYDQSQSGCKVCTHAFSSIVKRQLQTMWLVKLYSNIWTLGYFSQWIRQLSAWHANTQFGEQPIRVFRRRHLFTLGKVLRHHNTKWLFESV